MTLKAEEITQAYPIIIEEGKIIWRCGSQANASHGGMLFMAVCTVSL